MVMIENGMIVGAESYDVQLQEILKVQCPICSHMLEPDELVYLQGYSVEYCEHCLPLVVDEDEEYRTKEAWRVIDYD